jgi:hypothetical protein
MFLSDVGLGCKLMANSSRNLKKHEIVSPSVMKLWYTIVALPRGVPHLCWRSTISLYRKSISPTIPNPTVVRNI